MTKEKLELIKKETELIKEKKELLRLKNRYIMNELKYQRETEKIFFDRQMDNHRIRLADIKKTDKRICPYGVSE